MVYGIVLLGAGMILAGLVLLIPGTIVEKVSLMIAVLNLVAIMFGLWILIPQEVITMKNFISDGVVDNGRSISIV